MICMLDKRQEMAADGSKEVTACRGFLTNVAAIVFSDYHLVVGNGMINVKIIKHELRCSSFI